jgi:hypothetical protein
MNSVTMGVTMPISRKVIFLVCSTRFSSILQWAVANTVVEPTSDSKATDPGRASQDRPFTAKLQMFLDLVFRRLANNVTRDDGVYSKDAVLRILRKQDKDAGN